MGNDELMKMMVLTMLNQQLQGRRTAAAGAADSDDEEDATGGQDKVTRGFARYSAYKQASKLKPNRVIEQYRQHVKDEMNIRAGDRWSYRDWWKTMPFNRFRSVGRVAYLLTEMLDTAEDDTVDEKARLQALRVGLIQSIKSCHQFALDGGDWKAAWPLAQVRDPYKHTAFGGTETELNLVAGLLRAEADLHNRVRHTKAGDGGSDKDAEGDKEKAPRRPPKGQGRGKGDGGGTAGGGAPAAKQ